MSQLLPDNLSSLEVLFKQHYTELCRYALKLTRNNEVAEEVVQEVFVNFWERREEINISYSVKAYLVASVRNRSINYLKLQLPKELKKEDVDNLSEKADLSDPTQIEYNELYSIVQKAIDLLPDRCKVIFVLSREEGLTYQEIAEKLELSVKTVENQMSIALKKLRVSLKPYVDKLGVILLALIENFL
ncbi:MULTISPECIES: RNA polymerase sigma-70 factor [unclassified Imperialibacter]|uniref:RNA polymerase sigma-70 factor n=1 Tax=unclassified Imperialibacter TaxID=2629706 RepID=UPI00186A607A|nr:MULTISPECIES: RNA polymerase sigma-70 factor [unclassified Imperialibacter]